MYVEHREKRYGPYRPVGGPIPLHRYRHFKQTQTQQRADRIEALAAALALPRTALDDAGLALPVSDAATRVLERPFVDPDPFQEFTYFNLLGQIPRSLLRLFQQCYGRWYERLSAEKAQRLVLD